MRKIAREAVIFCLLGAVIGSAYSIARQYRSFRQEAASEAEQVAACKQANASNPPPTPDGTDTKTGPGWDRPPSIDWCSARENFSPVIPQPSKALILFQQSLGGAFAGFFVGLALWCGYRLVRFAIQG